MLIPAHSLTCLSHKVMVEKLSDEILLRIFRFFLNPSPQIWPILVHICRKWRHLIFASHRALCIRLSCTHGTPVLKILDLWPALPLALEYGGSPEPNPPVPEDEENILTVLNRSDRISSIHLTLTKSLLENLSSIEGQFSELEDLVLLSESDMKLTVPRTIRWGPRLRRLHLTGIAFLRLPELLSSSKSIVDIQLHEMPGIGYFTPQPLLKALSGMTQLQSLSLRLLPDAALSVGPHSSRCRAVLPNLTCLRYQGTSECLNDLLAFIHAPCLAVLERSDILFSEHSFSVSLTRPASECFRYQVFCEPFSRQLSSLANFCTGFPAFVSLVEDLRICVTPTSSGQTASDREEWLKLFHAFEGTKRFYLAGNSDITTEIALALQSSKTALPALHKLCLQEPVSGFVPLQEAATSFMHSRLHSCHYLGVEYERRQRSFNYRLDGIGTTFV